MQQTAESQHNQDTILVMKDSLTNKRIFENSIFAQSTQYILLSLQEENGFPFLDLVAI